MMYLCCHSLSLPTNQKKPPCLRKLPGFFWSPMAYHTAYRCLHTTRIDLAARFTWFLIISYGLSVFAQHEREFANPRSSICLRNLLGFLWFPMVYRCLHLMEIPGTTMMPLFAVGHAMLTTHEKSSRLRTYLTHRCF